MPLVHVNMSAGRTAEQKRALLAAITTAVQNSVGAPVESIRVWITEFPATDFMAGGEILADRQAQQMPQASGSTPAAEKDAR